MTRYQIFIAAILSSVLYSIMFLCLRGTLVFGDGIHVQLGTHNSAHGWASRLNGNVDEYRGFLSSIASSLLWSVHRCMRHSVCTDSSLTGTPSVSKSRVHLDTCSSF